MKVITYNIKSGIYHPDGLEAVATVLEAARPDVVALQEVDRGTRRANHEDQAAWLAERLAMPHHCFGAATPWEGGGEYGVALISSLPLNDPKVTQLWVPRGEGVPHGAQEPRVVLSARIDWKEPAGGGSDSGDSESTVGDGARAPIIVMVTHLGLTDEQRLRQARQLLEVAADGGSLVVLMGDLNGTPDSPEVRHLATGLRDVMGEVAQTERITFPSGDPEMHGDDFLARAIDFIFVGEGLEVESARVIADYTLASDHNPCEAVLRVRPSPLD